MYLYRQLACWSKNQRTRLILAAFFTGRMFQQLVENSDQERGCLAGAGLCFAGYILPLESDGQGLLLDWRTVLEAGILQAPVDFIQ